MRFGMLGPLHVWTDRGTPVRIAERKVRTVLAQLLVRRGYPVPTAELIDTLWPGTLPANPSGVLRSKVSQLRRVLEDAEPGGHGLVVSHRPGYRLQPAPGSVDADQFAALCREARACGDPARRAALLTEALGLWRGSVLADSADESFARAAAPALEEQRLTAEEDLIDARLARGEHTALVGELAALVTQHPRRERLRAAQMKALYRAGRQSEALDSYQELRGLLRESLGTDPGPELTELYVAILHHDPALTDDGAATVRPVRTNLPAPARVLVGRDSAVAHASTLLDQARLVTLTGPGGVGKTRLAAVTAGRRADAYPDGVWLVELSAVDPPGGATPPSTAETSTAGTSTAGTSTAGTSTAGTSADPVARVVECLTTVLGMPDMAAGPDVAAPSGGQAASSPAARLAHALRDHRVLFVLDNCEHVVSAAATVVDTLLRDAPGVRVLATSREPLGIDGEELYPVPPLDVPDAAETGDPAALQRYSAVALFVDRAAAAAPGFRLTEHNADAVAAVCRGLDGIPLALELAATRVRNLGVAGLADRLDDRFRLLRTGRRDAPARQQTLQAVIDWSWQLLSATEQAVLRRLAVHAHDCPLAAAEYVCAGDPVAREDVPQLLGYLVDRSLVTMVDGPEGPRYRLLESVAAYSYKRLVHTRELTEARRRHTAYYTELAERTDPHLRGPEQRHRLRQLDAETANVRAALDGALADGDRPTALRLACALVWYWVLRGRLGEGSRSLGAALACPGPAPDGLRITAATWQYAISLLAGREPHPAAQDADWRADPLTTGADPYAMARAQGLLAVVVPHDGEQDLVDRAVEVAEQLDYRWGVAAALSTRAWEALVRSDFRTLREDAERSVALFREFGDEWGVLHATDPLAALAAARGDWTYARHLHRDGLRVAQELGLWSKVAYKLSELGRLALVTGDDDAADELHQRARRLAAEQSYPAVEQAAELGLAVSARRQGRGDEAERLLWGWLSWNRRTGWDAGAATICAELGYVAEQRGDAEAALARHWEGYCAACAAGEPRGLALALEGLAGVCALTGDHTHAACLLGAAHAARTAVGAPYPTTGTTDVERATARARAGLGADLFARTYAAGQQLTPEQCVRRTVPGAGGPSAPPDAPVTLTAW